MSKSKTALFRKEVAARARLLGLFLSSFMAEVTPLTLRKHQTRAHLLGSPEIFGNKA